MSSPSKAPDWLQSTLRKPTLASDEFRELEPTDHMPGDIVVVVPIGGANACGRLLVVVNVDNDHFHGMLVIAEAELATSADAVLVPESTGLGYEIAVLTHYHGPLWTVQVQHRVGAIEKSALEQLERLMWNDEPDGLSLRRGQPLQPEGIDPRYPTLRSLSLEFDQLTDHYRRRCHDLELPTLDANLGKIDVLEDLISRRGWERRITLVSMTTEFRDRFLDSLPQLSPDQQRAAQLIGEQMHNLHPPTTFTEVEPEEDLVNFDLMVDSFLQEVG